MTHAKATLLLPARSRFPGGSLPARVASALGRADRSTGDAGESAQLRRHFQALPEDWSAAALTRQVDAGDAAGSLQHMPDHDEHMRLQMYDLKK